MKETKYKLGFKQCGNKYKKQVNKLLIHTNLDESLRNYTE